MEPVKLVMEASVAEIVLDRPDKLNAVNFEMLELLRRRIEEAAQARCVLVRGEGRAFCAGRDLSEADPEREDAADLLASKFNPVVEQLFRLPVPTIAAVQGACMGFGLGLAFACDVVLAADDAQFSSPFNRLGAIPDSGGHFHFLELLGRHRALELIYTGRRLSGREAEAWGLVNRSVPRTELLDVARAMAKQIAAGPTKAFSISKRLLVSLHEREFLDVLQMEAAGQGEASRSSDFVEGIRAFQQKRAPRFVGA
jgi:2-(1,2-epoxy-1,2-dihydrophenyl)acetyl-CoA isomerase